MNRILFIQINMKLFRSIILGGLVLVSMSLTSCKGWLDVNVDPENPSSESATYQTRLGHIEFYTNSATQFAAWRNGMAMGDWTRYYNGGTYYLTSIWYPTNSITTTPYQWWFVGAACNIEDMIKKAESAEAWHYAGVGKVIFAYGHMLMTDLYGEMPFTEATGQSATPAYDNGKTIYLGCLEALDKGIEYLKKSQAASLPSLAEGDWWLKGDVAKWVKFANLLKARWCVKLSKKAAGNYLEGKYDAATILAALSEGPQSIADDAIIQHTDDNSSTHDVLGWDEPVDYSPLYSVCGMNAGYMVTEMLYNNLTNFKGLGVEDPRADKIIPWAMSAKSDDSPANIKFSGEWRRSLGVDLTSNLSPNLSNGPIRSNFGKNQDSKNEYPHAGNNFWIPSNTEARLGDTVYVEATNTSKGYAAAESLLYKRNGGFANSKESGSFYVRVSSPTFLGTYAEACFIKAEVLFNQGNKGEAMNAYKAGIKASMDRMNIHLQYWLNGDASLGTCPSFTTMSSADIDSYVNTLGAQTLTLGDILTQKRLALQFSMEIWNDMRRYDFDKNLFYGWAIPVQHSFDTDALKAIPAGKEFRRWRQCSHEYNYNSTSLQAIGKEVPGADISLPQWNLADDVWTINVWWDSTQD